MITETGLNLIKHFESFRSAPYFCPAGYQTIGYGHVIRSGESLEEITKGEGEALLLSDVAKAEASVLRLIKVALEENQYDALVSFTFNLGGGALQRSTLRQKVNREEHAEVPDEFKKWIYSGCQVLRGLIRRRIMEAILYEG